MAQREKQLKKLFETLLFNYNVSTILILPSLQKEVKTAKYKGKEIEIPMIQLLLEHGLMNTFNYTDKDKSGDNLYLLFDREVIKKKFNITNHVGYSALEYLLSFPNFDSIYYMNNDFIVYKFKLESKLRRQYDLIRRGLYSRVSKEYKTLIRTNNSEVIVTKNEIAKDIVKYNIPFSITSQSSYLKKMWEDFYNLDNKKKLELENTDEYFKPFRLLNETFSERTIKKLIKREIKCQTERSMT